MRTTLLWPERTRTKVFERPDPAGGSFDAALASGRTTVSGVVERLRFAWAGLTPLLEDSESVRIRVLIPAAGIGVTLVCPSRRLAAGQKPMCTTKALFPISFHDFP